MKIILFTHPSFMQSQSMPRYAKMLWDYFKAKGDDIQTLSPSPFFYKLGFNSFTSKWFGYIDQYIVFPLLVWIRLRKYDKDTLFVFADQALGPWVPLVATRKHIVHCHDFLALRSALGEFAENPTSFSGRLYQSFIRKGFSKGKNFISVSKQTQADLHKYYLGEKIEFSEVVYNGLNQTFEKLDPLESKHQMESFINKKLPSGYILHVGGNQWYKNREGAIDLYSAWRSEFKKDIPLILLGQTPEGKVLEAIEKSEFKSSIYLALDTPNDFVNKAYSGATLLLFPSLAEGFGWPIAEALASGTLVITTNEAPMNEVGGEIAYYIKRMPHEKDERQVWLKESSKVLENVIGLSQEQKDTKIHEGLNFVERFSTEQSLNAINNLYTKIV
ncbi:glycosyltransferase [Cytophaga aurantiaca]|uniref:glycosyltransferase n=1 Tax=Cytophaga aurantiaca TaxID=29530 RepID=UPI0004775CBD|nr:glycosyltransferase [Cytophaga aurantiaca]